MASAQPDADMDTCVGSETRLLATCHMHAKLQQSLHYHTRPVGEARAHSDLTSTPPSLANKLKWAWPSRRADK